MKASPLYRAFWQPWAAGFGNFPDDVLRLARRVVDGGLDGVGSGFVVREETDPL